MAVIVHMKNVRAAVLQIKAGAGNYRIFFCSTYHFSIYLSVNISSYFVFKLTLFKMTFQTSIWCFYTGKSIRGIAYFKKNFWSTFYFLWMKLVNRQLLSIITNMVYVFPTWSTKRPSKKVICSKKFLVTSSLVSFF